MPNIKLNVDKIIQLNTIRYQPLVSNETEDVDAEQSMGVTCNGSCSLADDDDKNLNLLDEEDLALMKDESFLWFRRSIYFLLFFIGFGAFLLFVLVVLSQYYAGSSFENSLNPRISIDLKRLEVERYSSEMIKQQSRNWFVDSNQQTTTTNQERTTPTNGTVAINTLGSVTRTSNKLEIFTAKPLPVVIHQNSKYIPPQEVKDLVCSNMFRPDYNFFHYRWHRPTYRDTTNEFNLPMDCESIKSRAYFQVDNLYPEEQDFPIAFARAIYTDYRFLEMELAATYSPQNYYCYALDSKASSLFHKRMQALASCFSNVFLTPHEFRIDSNGHNMNYAHYECMKLLARPGLKWKYMVLLQNHDVALKTNQELVQIYKWFNGTNDISAKVAPRDRINSKTNWTFAALHLFKNKSRNLLSHHGFEPIMHLVKSLVQVSASREMIDFMLNKLDLRNLMREIQWKAYGIDELLMGSLNAADAVEVPGGFTSYCLKQGREVSSITRLRLTHWSGDPCKSGMRRHAICILSAEHLNELSGTYHLFGNKMMSESDFGAISCWHELMFNRTHLDRDLNRLKSSIYLNLPHVRFNREKHKQGNQFNLTDFSCI